jgi:2,5-furandicarboxylate decarboxylase 1
MNWVRDPATGHYNVMNALTTITGPNTGFSLFISRDTTVIFERYKEMGVTEVPIAFVIGIPPAYEIMGNYAGVHMDSWGETDMFGTIMDQDVEMVRCETIDLMVPAQAGFRPGAAPCRASSRLEVSRVRAWSTMRC